MATVIHFDPFYDTSPTQRAASPGQPGQPAVATTGYQDPNSQIMEYSGRSQASYLPRRNGLEGVIVPVADEIGQPIGYDPRDAQNLVVNIDPHIPGQSSTLSLGALTQQVVQQSQEIVRRTMPAPRDTASRRLNAAAVYHAAGDLTNGRGAAVLAPVAEDFNTPDAPPRPAAALPPSARQGRVSPLAAFGTQPAPAPRPTSRPPRVLDLSGVEAAPPVAQAAEPAYRVTFGIQGFGEHEASYHDVILKPTFLVLVYDLRCRYAGKYFPSAADDAPPMALNIEGSQAVYLVHSTGFQYVYEGKEHCVLMIEKQVPLPAEAQE